MRDAREQAVTPALDACVSKRESWSPDRVSGCKMNSVRRAEIGQDRRRVDMARLPAVMLDKSAEIRDQWERGERSKGV